MNLALLVTLAVAVSSSAIPEEVEPVGLVPAEVESLRNVFEQERSGKGTCFDNIAYRDCNYYKDAGRCTSDSYVRRVCQYTCGICVKYRLGQSGTMNCPEGFQLVTNEQECRDSAGKLGKSFSSVGCFLTEIPGCLDNGDAIWFSTCKNTHHQRHVSVCKEGKGCFWDTDCPNDLFCIGLRCQDCTNILSDSTCNKYKDQGYCTNAPNVHWVTNGLTNGLTTPYINNNCRKTCTNCECTSLEFKCNNNKCIGEQRRCDGNNDCGDMVWPGSDELECGCSGIGVHTYFKCNNGKCLSPTYVGNGRDDCGDGSDEGFCSTDADCPNGLECGTDKKCDVLCNDNSAMDNGETGVDCGGGGCPACAACSTYRVYTAGKACDGAYNLNYQGNRDTCIQHNIEIRNQFAIYQKETGQCYGAKYCRQTFNRPDHDINYNDTITYDISSCLACSKDADCFNGGVCSTDGSCDQLPGTYPGWCRYGENLKDSFESESDEDSFAECEEECQKTKGCVAFSYETPTPEEYYNCYRYRGGPYTSGSFRVNTTCYIMPEVPCSTESDCPANRPYCNNEGFCSVDNNDCKCKSSWTWDIGGECAKEQHGCTNCDEDPSGNWCIVANPGCKTVQENKWSYCASGDNIIRDDQGDNKKCAYSGSNRVFVLRGGDALEHKCRKACTINERCIAFSGIWNSWCIGCDVELTDNHNGAIAFKKTV